MEARRDPWLLAAAAALAVGAAMRVWNLAHYPVDMGFDAQGNWSYVELLTREWRLPLPNEGWSTSHAPLFYAVAGAIARLAGATDKEVVARSAVLFSSALGLLSALATGWLVLRADPGNRRRAMLAVALVTFLPVHLYVSTMLSEEILASALVTFAATGLAVELLRSHDEDSRWTRVALLGAVAGLALLTKLSGVLVIAAGSIALLARRSGGHRFRPWFSAAAFGLAAAIFGGWFYLRNLAQNGYLYPYDLSQHAIMHDMPPGARTAFDYLSVPTAAFTGTDVADPALLHSVWGGTHLTIWFDGHRHFLPKRAPGLEAAARFLLLLGLVPVAAFAIGCVRGARRALRGNDVDRLLLLLVGFTLAGYIAFTWRNPWFATVKGSYLLGLVAPFGYYASEVLDGWLRGRAWKAFATSIALACLLAAVIVTFTWGLAFAKREFPGPDWKPVPSAAAAETHAR